MTASPDCRAAHRAPLSRSASVRRHRQDRQLLRTVRRFGIEEQGIAGMQRISLVGVAIEHFPAQHEDELDAGVLEERVGLRLLGEGDQVRLYDHRARERVSRATLIPIPSRSWRASRPRSPLARRVRRPSTRASCAKRAPGHRWPRRPTGCRRAEARSIRSAAGRGYPVSDDPSRRVAEGPKAAWGAAWPSLARKDAACDIARFALGVQRLPGQ